MHTHRAAASPATYGRRVRCVGERGAAGALQKMGQACRGAVCHFNSRGWRVRARISSNGCVMEPARQAAHACGGSRHCACGACGACVEGGACRIRGENATRAFLVYAPCASPYGGVRLPYGGVRGCQANAVPSQHDSKRPMLAHAVRVGACVQGCVQNLGGKCHEGLLLGYTPPAQLVMGGYAFLMGGTRMTSQRGTKPTRNATASGPCLAQRHD